MPGLWRLEGGESKGLPSLLSSGPGGQEKHCKDENLGGGDWWEGDPQGTGNPGDKDQRGSWQSSFLEQGNRQGNTELRLQHALWVGMATIMHVNN